MPHGGYVAENGISVCDECHIKAEGHWNGSSADPEFSPEKLYDLIGSSYETATLASERLGD